MQTLTNPELKKMKFEDRKIIFDQMVKIKLPGKFYKEDELTDLVQSIHAEQVSLSQLVFGAIKSLGFKFRVP